MSSGAEPSFDLSGRTAIVTGGAGILGRRFCKALAERGARVAVVDVDGDAAQELAKKIEVDLGTETLGVACDVADLDSVDAMLATVLDRFGNIEILHNNAASKSSSLDAFFAPFEEYSLKTWREVTAVNLDGMFLVAQAVGRRMLQQGKGGSIIMTASIYGVVAPDQRIYEGSQYMGRPINSPAVYSATKAAVVGLARHLAALWAEHAIRVNALTPGGIESGQNEAFRSRYASRVPMARMGRVDELTGALIYLASDASSYVTGQNLIVDGGLTCW